MTGYLVYFGLPVVLLSIGFPDLPHPARHLARRRPLPRRRADGDDPDLHVRQPRQFPAARRSVLRAGGRDHGAGRHRAARHRLGDVDDRRRARLARGDDGRGLGTVRRDVAHRGRHGRRHGPDDLSLAARQRLQRPLRGRADRVLGRHRGRHPALDRDDPLFDVGAAIGRVPVHRRHPAEPPHRRGRRRLRHGLRALQGGAAGGARELGEHLDHDQGGELVDRHARGDLRRHLWRHLHPDRGGGRRRRLFGVRDHVHLSRGRVRRSVAHPHQRGLPHLADPDHRHLGGNLFLAADHERHPAADRRMP